MQLIDLVIDWGQAGKAPQKISFKPGYNLLISKDALFLSEFGQLLAALFYPQTIAQVNPAITSLLSKYKRLGLTFSQQRIAYRLVRDCQGGVISLARQQQGESEFVEISREAAVIEQLSSQTLGLPSCQNYLEFFANSLQPVKFVSRKAANVTEDYFVALDQGGKDDLSAARQRLQQVEKQLAAHQQIVELERQQTEVQGSLFKLEDVQRKLDQLKEELVAAQKSYEPYIAYDDIKGLPKNLAKAVEDYESLLDYQAENRYEQEQRAEKLMSQALSMIPTPLFRQPAFLFLSLAMVVCFVLAVSMLKLRYPLLLGGVGAMVGVAFLVSRNFLAKEKYAKCQEGLKVIEAEKRKIERRFELETAPLRSLMKRYEVEHAKDLLFLEKDRLQALKEVERANQALEKFKAEVNATKLAAELSRLGRESALLDKKLMELNSNGLSDDIYTLQNEAAALRGRINGLSPNSAAAAEALDNCDNPYDKLLIICAQLFRVSSEEFLKSLSGGLNLNLQAISGKRFLEYGLQGNSFSSVIQNDGQKIALAALPVADSLLVSFALRFTCLQYLATKVRFPVLFELKDESSLNPELLAKSLAHLAKSLQIIQLAGDSKGSQLADNLAIVG